MFLNVFGLTYNHFSSQHEVYTPDHAPGLAPDPTLLHWNPLSFIEFGEFSCELGLTYRHLSSQHEVYTTDHAPGYQPHRPWVAFLSLTPEAGMYATMCTCMLH